MKNIILIDANIIIRLLTKTPSEQYNISKNLFEKIAKKEIKALISEGILMECYFVLTKFYKFDKQKVLSKLKIILELQNIISDDKYILIETLNILEKKNIDFMDALLCAKNNLLGYEIASFDKDIKKCDGKYYKQKT